jgi:putative RecB family exonuclease
VVEIPGSAPTPLVAPTPAGPAVERDEPRRPALSPSRAADFKQCPLLYRFRAIDRLPEVPTPAQVRGTLVHAVLERLLALPAAQRVPEAARALVAPAWAQLCADEPGLLPAPSDAAPADPAASGDDPTGDTADPPRPPDAPAWPAGVDALLDAYFALEDPRLVEPEAREQRVEVELESGLLLRGYVDRVDRVGGDYHVVDYKTGAAPGPTTEARALFPMKFYALVLLLLRGRVPRELRLMYLTGATTLHYVPDEEQLRRFGRTLDAMWSAIRAADAAGEFRPDPGPSCAWCSHRALCPAWGGTPPPYPGGFLSGGSTPPRSVVPPGDDGPGGA